jgi:hypothetical protein
MGLDSDPWDPKPRLEPDPVPFDDQKFIYYIVKKETLILTLCCTCRRTESLLFKFVPLYSLHMPSDVMFTANTTTTSINLVDEMTVSRQLSILRRAEVRI